MSAGVLRVLRAAEYARYPAQRGRCAVSALVVRAGGGGIGQFTPGTGKSHACGGRRKRRPAPSSLEGGRRSHQWEMCAESCCGFAGYPLSF